ncbi:laminin subunit gamma-1 isoform X1 [Centropristis striata]|uniref:laminin subunit gamma-1 isoform X1 n=1 Tax=Centropristis striata TaxID=184440 RepID=UPI0027E03220|nr:laminin subunit gamma-1 isoform X1 [Centropristis striata]
MRICLRALVALSWVAVCARAAMDECGDAPGRAQRCMPEFVNAAFNVTVVATNTCGAPPEEYCVQTGATGVTKSCHICDARDPRNHHSAVYLTDYNNQQDTTWWQSQTMLAGIQYPNSINLTLHLGKSFDITYVRLKFHTSRPESFAIYKRTSEGGPWVPYQYYSGSCEKTYRKASRGFIRTGEDEQQALCTDDFSDISPLTGGNVAFSTLEGRPSAYNFDNSPVLQDWVTATDIRVTLNRLNTFGDEVFNDPKVLKSYYYAISDFAVGGRCKCNGHASECVKNSRGRLVCNCKHNTDGDDCNVCKPFYNDRPWRRATADSPNDCLPCDCNGKSSECYFDAELYRARGHGGHCRNCADNTDGPNCERCLDNYYRDASGSRCLACSCNTVGSESPQCDNRGVCACKPGVSGEKCDRCQPGFHSLTEAGCRPCSCSPSGSTQECDVNTGQCRCKDNVEGFSCDRCKLGFFNLDPQNAQGCTPCFCFQHSSVCDSADGFSVHTVTSSFHRDDDQWTGQQRDGSSVPVQWSPSGQEISLISEDYFPMYFVAPEKFLGDQLLSYGQNLTLSFRVDRRDTRLSAEDLVLEGADLRVAVPLIAQGNAYPNENMQTYVFRLHDSTDYPWRPTISHADFQKLLHNLTAVKIRGTYSEKSAGYLDDVTLVTARRGPGVSAHWVERCTCPQGYQGQHCEQCTLGYRRARPELGAFSSCEPCNCNGHSEACNPDSGACDCRDHTSGLSCERCKDGFYGDATRGSSDDCQPCPCPAGATCAVVPKTREVVCTNCPTGTTGKRCELCDDGFFGDPLGASGPPRPCRACKCSDNIDPNAVGNCNRSTGECLKCIDNTDGFFCDRCKDGFYGNALATSAGDKCKPCSCSPAGTVGRQTACSQVTGQCQCLPNVAERDCSACEPGFFNLMSNNGCERCNCNPIGSTNGQCDITSGQCECQPGVTGRHCERCEVNFFGFGSSGCKPCDCDPEGSQSGQCKEDGRCECRPGFVGTRCDMCEENYFYNRSAPGCQQCPSCYSLVRDKVNQQRQKLQDLQTLIDNLGSGQDVVSDKAFEDRLKEAERAIEELLDEAQSSKDVDRGLLDRLNAINGTLTTQWNRLQNIRGTVDSTGAQADRARQRVRDAESLIEHARQELDKAKDAIRKVDIKPPSGAGDPNNMTLLAEEARTLADKHKMDADQIEKIARDANDTSTKALNLLQKTLEGEGRTSQEIDELNKKYNEAKELAKSLEKQAHKVQAEAEDASSKALKIFANLTSVPPLDTKSLEDEASKIKKEASDLDKLIDKTEKEYNDLRDDLKGKEQEVRKLLEKGRSEQQTADQLLARADAAKAVAEEAAKKGQQTFREAENILDDLRDFDRRVNDNKTAAEEALTKIPAINATIMDANRMTKQAEAALGNAAADARQAKSTAEEAERIASSVQKGSAKTKEDAEKAFQDTNQLDDEVSDMMQQLDAAEDELARKKAAADQDMMMASMASDNAKEAEDNARKAKSAVKTVLSTISALLDQLGNIDKVDLSKLNQIDESLKRAKSKMGASELDRKLAELNDVARSQEGMINDYDQQIREIRADIANLDDIKKTLPDGCFNTPSLERP